MKVIKGDLIKLAKEGKFDVIIHGCNCFNTMGAGIAKTIAKEFPNAYVVDQKTAKGSIEKLGNISIAYIFDSNPYVINAYTQYKYSGPCPVEYLAIDSCMKEVAKFLQETGNEKARIGIPRIGAGLAGGDWDIISKIIDKRLGDYNLTLVEFDRG
jgi:O-acetyl-ADP-ribose deacetylase (regulator of RNase III)